MKERSKHIIYFIVVGAILVAPVTGMLLGLDGWIESTEKRTMATVPSPKEHSFKEFTKAFDQYFADNFGFRNEFVFANNIGKVKGLRTSSFDDVVLGKEGWLFYRGEDIEKDFKGGAIFNETQLQNAMDTLLAMQELVQNSDISCSW